MAKTDIKTLKNWFRSLAKPPQEHFWNWMDSYWHKDEKIPANSIAGLNELLDDGNDVDLTNYLMKDGNNLDDGSRELLREKLGVGDVPENVATVDFGGEEGNVYTKEQAYSKTEIDTTYKGISVTGEEIKYTNDTGQTYDVLTTEFSRFKSFLENLTDSEKQQVFIALGSLRVVKLEENDAIPTSKNSIYIKQIP
ncbi:hypothetical protein GO491_03065 [Flavobacteriaceae bacterium Ap0902]|nr:hypothetical protein [Flavobacteriaceae bacterium Ap0902]